MGSCDCTSATPKKAWKTMAANSTSMSIGGGHRRRPGSMPTRTQTSRTAGDEVGGHGEVAKVVALRAGSSALKYRAYRPVA
jgi:hypothetical protein